MRFFSATYLQAAAVAFFMLALQQAQAQLTEEQKAGLNIPCCQKVEAYLMPLLLAQFAANLLPGTLKNAEKMALTVAKRVGIFATQEDLTPGVTLEELQKERDAARTAFDTARKQLVEEYTEEEVQKCVEAAIEEARKQAAQVGFVKFGLQEGFHF